jgi:hypothetical protein
MAGNKSYSSDGDLTAIEIWNLTAPADPDTLKTMSWNTRPKRVSLLGTVNFTSIETQRRDLELDGQELRAPTPRFHCLGNMQITVEVVCTTCRLEFDQVFSNPPLGSYIATVIALSINLALQDLNLCSWGSSEPHGSVA